MLSAFVHRRPLLRALLALVLFAGLVGTAASTHASLTAGHFVATAVDTAAGDVDASAPDGAPSAEDNASSESLDLPTALTVHLSLSGTDCCMTAHAAPLQWHASPELRPPNA